MNSGNISRLSLCVYAGLWSLMAGCGNRPGEATSALNQESGIGLAGTWAKMAVFTSNSSAAGINAQSRVARYVLLKIQDVGGQFVASEQTCDIKTASSGGSTVEFSQKLIQSISPNTYIYELGSNGVVTMKNAVELLGVTLANKATDTIPVTGSQVLDQDNDGNPGVSVDISAKLIFTIKGQVYVVQRTTWSESGTFDGSGKISGLIDWKIEQKTLGASNPLLTAVSPTITTLTKDSPVTMVKIADGATCADVIKERGKGLGNL